MEAKKIRIVHLTPTFGCGGLEKVIANLVSESDPSKFEHIVVSLTDDISFQYALPQNTKIYTLNKQPGKDFGCHIRAFKLFKQLKPDVLHSYNFGTMEYQHTALLAGVKRRIHADHGYGGDDSQGSSKKRQSLRLFTSFILSRYVVVSESLRSWAHYVVGVKERKIQIIRNGIPVPEQCPSPPQQKKRLLIVGRLAEVKNHHRLINGFVAAIKQENIPNLDLIIVGSGPMESALKNRVHNLPESIGKHIFFEGHSDDPTPYYTDADAFILTSNFEAMPMTALEAMSAGRPVLLPQVGGIPDSIPSDSCIPYQGHCDDAVRDAILFWYSMPQSEISRVARNGFETARGFSVSKMANEYADIYTSK